MVFLFAPPLRNVESMDGSSTEMQEPESSGAIGQNPGIREKPRAKRREAAALARKSPPFAENAKGGAPSSSCVGWCNEKESKKKREQERARRWKDEERV